MHSKQGVILCNLGTPLTPTASGVRQFLASFLSDQRVVELPRVIWLPILYGLILPIRSLRVAKAYAAIWTEQGSPLQAMSQRQSRLLEKLYEKEGVSVAFAMSYGKPSLADALDNMHEQGIERIVVLPLYPQYSATTTASVYDQWGQYCSRRRNLPSVTLIKDYYDHADYIAALARSVTKARSSAKNGKPEKNDSDEGSDSSLLLFSFHGIPQVNVKKGDPYQQQCERTARLVAERLGLDDSQWLLSFQSRFGKQEWLKPYTDNVLQQLGQAGRSIDVICPAFASDCLETLEEISIESREMFFQAGGENFNYIPCLNDNEDHIQLFYTLTKRFLASEDFSPQKTTHA